ncbi:MAG: hypothetical protein EZS28_022213, partial [Streblomastix strix]
MIIVEKQVISLQISLDLIVPVASVTLLLPDQSPKLGETRHILGIVEPIYATYSNIKYQLQKPVYGVSINELTGVVTIQDDASVGALFHVIGLADKVKSLPAEFVITKIPVTTLIIGENEYLNLLTYDNLLQSKSSQVRIGEKVFLKAIIYPVTATYQNVSWLILEGGSGVSINKNGQIDVSEIAQIGAIIKIQGIADQVLSNLYEIEIVKQPVTNILVDFDRTNTIDYDNRTWFIGNFVTTTIVLTKQSLISLSIDLESSTKVLPGAQLSLFSIPNPLTATFSNNLNDVHYFVESGDAYFSDVPNFTNLLTIKSTATIGSYVVIYAETNEVRTSTYLIEVGQAESSQINFYSDANSNGVVHLGQTIKLTVNIQVLRPEYEEKFPISFNVNNFATINLDKLELVVDTFVKNQSVIILYPVLAVGNFSYALEQVYEIIFTVDKIEDYIKFGISAGNGSAKLFINLGIDGTRRTFDTGELLKDFLTAEQINSCILNTREITSGNLVNKRSTKWNQHLATTYLGLDPIALAIGHENPEWLTSEIVASATGWLADLGIGK